MVARVNRFFPAHRMILLGRRRGKSPTSNIAQIFLSLLTDNRRPPLSARLTSPGGSNGILVN
jgi:hypothetical protein